MLEYALPIDPSTNDRRIVVPQIAWTKAERKFIETALECAQGMRDWWLVEQTKYLRKALDGKV